MMSFNNVSKEIFREGNIFGKMKALFWFTGTFLKDTNRQQNTVTT